MPRMKRVVALALALALVVALVAACGPKQATVPSVVGQTESAATAALAAAKFSAGTVTQDFSETVAAGTVTLQTPAAGSQAAEGSPVELVVSKGIAPVAVPDVKGMDSSQASSALTAVGLSMVSYDDDDATIAAGMSLGQLPTGGSEVAKGTEVIVGFSTGVAPTDQTVPNLVGATKASAEAQLKKKGFKVSEQTAHVVGAKSGIVVAQVPAQGAKATPDSHVIIMIASGSPEGAIPSVNGMSRTAANNTITDAGFKPNVYQMASAQGPSGRVFAQLAAAGAQELQGSVNAVVISLGKLTATGTPVPTVTGQTEAEAIQAAKSAGFVPVTLQVHDPSVPVGAVVAQVPAAGASAKPGQQILMSVSQGSILQTQVKVPIVTKMTTVVAQTTLKKAGLQYQLGHLFSPTVAKGSVMGQLPAAGASVLKGADVQIVISLGKPPALFVTVPDFKGMTDEAATAEISNLGLVSVDVATPALDKAPGTVLQQFPMPGSSINPGSQVVLMVAR
ncbi:MAG: PASTA domain-containing protein [Coriobacteriia bacterium]